jgi:hypothetical protein
VVLGFAREVWGEHAEGELGGFSRYFYQMSIRRGPKLMGNEFLMRLAVYMERKRKFMSVSRFATANGILTFPWLTLP